MSSFAEKNDFIKGNIRICDLSHTENNQVCQSTVDHKYGYATH